MLSLLHILLLGIISRSGGYHLRGRHVSSPSSPSIGHRVARPSWGALSTGWQLDLTRQRQLRRDVKLSPYQQLTHPTARRARKHPSHRASIHSQLQAVLDNRFSDGTRKCVLLVGAGLHHHLRGLTKEEALRDRWQYFSDWSGLLASVADDFNLERVEHEDPSATWESLVVRLAAMDPNGETRSAQAEREARKALAKLLRKVPADKNALQWLGSLLQEFRDVVCLNYDPSFQLAANAVGLQVVRTPGTKKRGLETLRSTFAWTHGGRFGRLWSPHGDVSLPNHIILGTTSYGKGLQKVSQAWAGAKAAEKSLDLDISSYWEERRAPNPYEPTGVAGRKFPLTWVDLFLRSDLVLLGTSLDRAETDLWWALHQRQRNLARVPEHERPRTFVLCAGEPSSHLATGPAGVEPVSFDTWASTWDSLVAS